MEFDGDAFISYAHLDNVELVEGRKGWVANLHRALEVRVAQLLGKSPHIWRDPKLQGNDLFAETLVEKLQRVAVLVTIVSPRYIRSEWTMRELKEFWAAAESQGGVRVGDKARVFKILKTPVPLDKTPPELKMLLGYEFFRIDPESGRVRELDEVFGPEAQREFWIKLDDLAHDLVALLEALHAESTAEVNAKASAEGEPVAGAPPAAPAASTPPAASAVRPAGHAAAPAPAKGAIFLAETTSDLRDQRELLRRDLLQHGHSVLPAQPLPYVASEAEAAIRQDLARCRLSVHLIGGSFSLVPEGGTRSMIELQHELATERAQDDRFLRLLWAPHGLRVTDERQAGLVERIRLDPRIQDRADFLETPFEDLRTTVQDWLTREPRPVAAAPATEDGAIPQLYLIADARDAEAIEPWAEALFDQHLEIIRPQFDGDETALREYHEENLTICDGVLIFYGSGNLLWLQRKLRELQKAPGYGRTKPRPVVGVCLIGARSPEKERFRSHEAIVIPQWDGVTLPALQSFIANVKAGPSV
jgi:hypothetical protein